MRKEGFENMTLIGHTQDKHDRGKQSKLPKDLV